MQGRGSDLPFFENSISSSFSFSSPLLLRHGGIEAWKGETGPGKRGQTQMCCRPLTAHRPPPQALQLEVLKGQKCHVSYLSDLPSLALRQKPPSRLASSLPPSRVHSALWVSLKCCCTSGPLGEATIPSCLDCGGGLEMDLPASCWWLADLLSVMQPGLSSSSRRCFADRGLLGLNPQGLPPHCH